MQLLCTGYTLPCFVTWFKEIVKNLVEQFDLLTDHVNKLAEDIAEDIMQDSKDIESSTVEDEIHAEGMRNMSINLFVCLSGKNNVRH